MVNDARFQQSNQFKSYNLTVYFKADGLQLPLSNLGRGQKDKLNQETY